MPPFPARNWTHGDSTTAGLAIDGTSAGWPTWTPRTSYAYNLAVAGHYSTDCYADLWTATTGEMYRYKRPERILMMVGINDCSVSGWSQSNRLGNMANLIASFLAAGYTPYSPSNPTQTGTFLMMTMLPQQYNSTDWTALHAKRTASNADFITYFGRISDSSNPVNPTGVDGSGGTFTAGTNSGGMPTTPVAVAAGLRCFLEIDYVLDDSYNGGSHLGALGDKFTYGGDNLGIHLNDLGEHTFAAYMTPYMLTSS